MILGIVGAEAAKFTELGRERAKHYIERAVEDPQVTEVVSGACHLGGVDIWAADIAYSIGRKVTEYPPRNRSWALGYKPRNLLIAQHSDKVLCVVVDKIPTDFRGMRFDGCYHCARHAHVIEPPAHVKSGGCWTMWKAYDMRKQVQLIVVNNF